MLLELASHFHPNRTTTGLLALTWKEKQLSTGIYSAEDASKPNISRHSFLFLLCCVLNIHFLTYIIYKGPCRSLNAHECKKRHVCFAQQSLAMPVKRFKVLRKPTSRFIPHFLYETLFHFTDLRHPGRLAKNILTETPPNSLMAGLFSCHHMKTNKTHLFKNTRSERK